MKSKELIKLLQAIDPTGDAEVFSGDGDIYTAVKLPYYYDGRPDILIKKEGVAGLSGVLGIREITDTDSKIYLYTMNLEDFVADFWECESMKYVGGASFMEKVEKYKKQNYEEDKKYTKDCFVKFCADKYLATALAAEDFFELFE